VEDAFEDELDMLPDGIRQLYWALGGVLALAARGPALSVTPPCQTLVRCIWIE
jgi:hypothetical protein